MRKHGRSDGRTDGNILFSQLKAAALVRQSPGNTSTILPAKSYFMTCSRPGYLFIHDEATLQGRVSILRSVRQSVVPYVGPSVTLSVTLLLFGPLEATYAVYTAMFYSIH